MCERVGLGGACECEGRGRAYEGWCPWKPKESIRSPGTALQAAVSLPARMLATESQPSGRVGRVPSCRDTSSANSPVLPDSRSFLIIRDGLQKSSWCYLHDRWHCDNRVYSRGLWTLTWCEGPLEPLSYVWMWPGMLERRKEGDSEAREEGQRQPGRSIAAGSSALRGDITGWLRFALISLVPELQPQCFWKPMISRILQL